jgi:ABC-2 type transport system ATP-binding protein
LLGRVQLGEKRRAYVRDLSGGQRQRLSVACALAGAPDILFLDEPTTGLDPQSRRALWDVCEEFRAGGGTILLTTHFMDEAERLADRVAIMDHGRILVQGSPRELIDTLGGAYVVEFEATSPLRAGARRARGRATCVEPRPDGDRLAADGRRAAPAGARAARAARERGGALVRADHAPRHARRRVPRPYRPATAR